MDEKRFYQSRNSATLTPRTSNRRNKNKQLEFLGQGSYGCGFRPPLPCLDKSKEQEIKKINDVPLVAKLFESESDLQEEVDIQKKHVEKFNSNAKFTPKFFNSCQINNTALTNEDYQVLKQCKFYNPQNKEPKKQIIMEYGGKDLNAFSKKNSFFSYFAHMKSLFTGLIAMHEKQFIHNDIKPHNIIFNPVNKRMLYIDFGLFHTYDDIFGQNFYNFHYKVSYWVYPPEYMLFVQYFDTIKDTTNSLPFFEWDEDTEIKMDRNFAYNEKRIVKSEYIFRLRQANNNKIRKAIDTFLKKISYESRLTGIKEYKKFIENKFLEIKKNSNLNYSNSKIDNDLINKKILKKTFTLQAHKICVYALGITLYNTFLESLTDTIIDSSKNKKHLLFQGIPLVLDFILKMIETNPLKRLSPYEALQQYENICKILKL